MGFLLDPPIAKKVQKMRSRVRWGAKEIAAAAIDQTRLEIANGLASSSAFSFLVIGDSGIGPQPFGHPQMEVANYMAAQMADSQFLLHMGDVVYQMGSPDQYPTNFIEPYQEWLVEGDRADYRRLTFRKPFLAVPGNHDYYNLPFLYGLLVASLRPLRQYFKVPITKNVSLRGSATGDTYARAFIDYLRDQPQSQLAAHLAQHYTTVTETGRALTYEAEKFTRLPNRYYQFRYGNIDFFGLDSSTFNRPVEIDGAQVLMAEQPWHNLPINLDWAQLFWLRDRLIASHQNPAVRGRIVYLHHPPYVTEATKYGGTICHSVRRHLRWVLDAVAAQLDQNAVPLLDLVLSGHAHCFEYLRTMETGHSDRHLNWIIAGGSGAKVRSQHTETTISESYGVEQRVIAKSQLYIGRHGTGKDTRWPYSFLRIDIADADSERLRLVVRPFITELHHDAWTQSEFAPLILTSS
ncbi:MAG: metallophosphoesterase [Cyanobacteria bacterium P01_C01_bin.120]